MINSALLLTQLQSTKTSRTTMVKRLEDDLRVRCDENPGVDAPLKAQYEAAKAKKRTALTYKAWREDELTNVAVAWVLACVFVRFLEDNELVGTPKLSGPGARLQRARDEHELFFRQHPTETEREYLLAVFEEMGRLPGMREFFDRQHNPLWSVAPSGDACRELWQFWQKTDPVTGALVHDFSDPDWNTRLLGDLYQDLSEAARKRYALLQTPVFVEQFILDRTLTPAIETFGFREVRMIDPTCGSGHFVLGGFERLFRNWQEECPGENPRVLAQKALDQVFGVDLNPNVVAIARFRLLLAALKVSGVTKLKDAPDFRVHLAAGDSLLHGRRFREFEGVSSFMSFDTEEIFRDEIKHHYEAEDADALHRILGQQYHAVVGNPPYITVKDSAVSQLYRVRYPSCSGKYALSVPFMERFFDLAVKGDGTPQQPGGLVGQITSNSFMKREFGKKLIEDYLSRWDLTHVLDTSGAYIPGHGTPTVILFGKNQPPVRGTIRTVLGIAGEPARPAEPALGLVWQAILNQIDYHGSVSEWMSAADSPRLNFHQHPWSIGGGGAAELKERIDEAADDLLDKRLTSIGPASFAGVDDAFVFESGVLQRAAIPAKHIRPFLTGDGLRDWGYAPSEEAFTPYGDDQSLLNFDSASTWAKHLWPYRIILESVVGFANKTRKQAGEPWFSWYRWIPDRISQPLRFVFPSVATHNHFVLERGRAIFNRHAPHLNFRDQLSDKTATSLAGVLNSSSGCFWLKQILFPKGGDHVGQEGARVRKTLWDERYEFDGTKISTFPIPAHQPSLLPTALVKISTALQAHSPTAIVASWGGAESGDLRPWLASARDSATRLRHQMIALQEELDWQIYEAFNLVESGDAVSLPEGKALDAIPPEGIKCGERAFEIVLARRLAAGEVQTTWFERHGSTPITEIPAHWPTSYRELIERRIARIADDSNIRLIEQPEYKRRWNTEPWDEQFTKAARDWLLLRLETYFFGGKRMEANAEFGMRNAEGSSSDQPSKIKNQQSGILFFIPSTRPHLATANQLADVAQTDAWFMEVAENYVGNSGFSVSKLVQDLVESASVPYLPVQRYKESGLRKRQDWEQVWELQRQEDKIDAEEKVDEPGISDAELANRQSAAKKRKQQELGDIPVPPKYTSADFLKSSFWKLRGKLDVPKERWVSYPGAERAGDDSLLIAWAGWDHLQQAQALAEYYIDARDNQGVAPERLKLLLAGLADLIPWLRQWHNALDPSLGMGLGDYFAGFLDEQCRMHQITLQDLEVIRFEPREEPTKQGGKTRGRKRRDVEPAKDDEHEKSIRDASWMDRAFALLAPNRRVLTDYRALVWPELLQQFPGELEFDVFRKAYWLLSEPTELENLGRKMFVDLPDSWWKSRSEQVPRSEFLDTLKGSVVLGDVKIWKEDGVRFIKWTGMPTKSAYAEVEDDARIALLLATQWEDPSYEQVEAEFERELNLLETP